MDAKQVKDDLVKFGLRLDLAGRSEVCIESFCLQMKGRQYGVEETAHAFFWFERGWSQAMIQARVNADVVEKM